MTSRERARAAVTFSNPDRIPAAFEAVSTVQDALMKRYGFTEYGQLLDRFNVDIAPVGPAYIGPELPSRTDAQGNTVIKSWWGSETTMHWTGREYNGITTHFPLAGVESIADLDRYSFPDPDWFDYESVKRQCAKYPGRAIIMGHEGPFQIATSLMPMEEMFILMVEDPELIKTMLRRMVDFELEYYERILIAADGQIDFLRPHDDYGTQISLLFSVDMWREFFKDNTKKLVSLAHRYGAFYQQHSCGCVEQIIPELIDCGVDVLEPLQKVKGLEPEHLYETYGGKIAFHGGIDTQGLLPSGTPDEVTAEVEHYKKALNHGGGYILMSSQAFEGDVPPENIEAIYSAQR
jgi:uroporphyrinogen decarboxylase